MKTIAEQIKDMEATRAAKAAQMEELMKKSFEADRTLDAGEAEEFDALDAEIKQVDADLARLRRLESLNGQKAKPVDGAAPAAASVSRSHAGHIIIKSADQEETFKGQNFTRKVIAKALAHMDGIPAHIAAERRWGKTAPTLCAIMKANEIEAGGTASGEWGAELVSMDGRYTGDFIEYLNARTVYNQLPFREIPANVTIKGQDGAATGYWVGEGKAIPPSVGNFSTVNLTPLKVAALSVITNELIRESSPSAEMLVRDALIEAIAQKIDTTVFSTDSAADGISPAGLLQGLTAIGSVGDDGESVRADVKNLYAPFITAKHAAGLCFVMNPALAKALQLMTNALGQQEFPGIGTGGGTFLGDKVFTGDNITSTHVILVDPRQIYKIGDMGIQISISKEAMIEMGTDATGAALVPTAASKQLVSMFQSESTAIKIVRPINFAKRRTTAVAYVDDADYGAVSSS